MTESVFESVEKSCQVLRLDFSSAELAILAQEQDLSPEQLQAVAAVLEHLRQKKVDTTIQTLLKMSRLPLKDPKTFENFDFSMISRVCRPCLRSMPKEIWPSLARPEPARPIWLRHLGMNAVRGALRPISLRCPSCGISSPPPAEPVKRRRS